MKILLTGAGGFLGQRIARCLLADGVKHLRLHYRNEASAKKFAALTTEFPDATLEFVGANLMNPSLMPSLVAGVDCIIHAAAGMRGAAADMFANSVISTRTLVTAAAAQKVRRIVLISSFSVYRTQNLPSGSVVSESTPLEDANPAKGPYGFAKSRQESLFREMQVEYGFESVILRPGVIYGPSNHSISPRVGIKAMGTFFRLGSKAVIPLTYVDNCASAVSRAALHAPNNAVFNVVDDDLPSCRTFLKAYRSRVTKLRTIPVPYWALLLGSKMVSRYHKRSRGQLPAVMTPYIVQSMYRPFSYTNNALKSIGWAPSISTADALSRSFSGWAEQLSTSRKLDL